MNRSWQVDDHVKENKKIEKFIKEAANAKKVLAASLFKIAQTLTTEQQAFLIAFNKTESNFSSLRLSVDPLIKTKIHSLIINPNFFDTDNIKKDIGKVEQLGSFYAQLVVFGQFALSKISFDKKYQTVIYNYNFNERGLNAYPNIVNEAKIFVARELGISVADFDYVKHLGTRVESFDKDKLQELILDQIKGLCGVDPAPVPLINDDINDNAQKFLEILNNSHILKSDYNVSDRKNAVWNMALVNGYAQQIKAQLQRAIVHTQDEKNSAARSEKMFTILKQYGEQYISTGKNNFENFLYYIVMYGMIDDYRGYNY